MHKVTPKIWDCKYVFSEVKEKKTDCQKKQIYFRKFVKAITILSTQPFFKWFNL